jgi:hypothetical protein
MKTDPSTKKYKLTTIAIYIIVWALITLSSCSAQRESVKPLSDKHLKNTTNTCYYNWTEYHKTPHK